MSMEQHPAAKQLMEAFMNVHRISWHSARGNQGYKKSEIMVLYCLNKAESNEESGLMVSEISRRLNVTSPTVTQLVKGMEASGLVERRTNEQDRRVVHILLTDKGRHVIKRGMDMFLASFDGLVEHLGEEESLQLAETMKKAAAYLQKQRDTYVNKLYSGSGEG